MKKGLRILSIILEASFIGSILLYIYNYYVSSKKYEIIPAEIKSRLNMFIIAAIVLFILFLIVKYVLYLTSRTYEEVVEESNIEVEREKKYRNLEAPVTERVFIYKDQYDIPKDRQMSCPNCHSTIDKNAFICVKCGYLIKKIVQEKVVEKVIEKPVERKVVERVIERRPGNVVVKKNNNYNKARLMNMLINIGLVVAIVITIILIINQAIQRGIL